MGGKIRKGFAEAVLLAVVAGVILGAGWVMARAYDTQKAYTPTNLIRLHIIGNSDSLEDQEVKLRVRDSIINTFGKNLLYVTDAKQAERIITELLPEIENAARKCLAKSGIEYNAQAKLETVFFPDKYYETSSGQTVFLPEGAYKSLQVVLGAGKGQNWWCVMYPPMCYIDIVRGTEFDQVEIYKTLTETAVGADHYVFVDEDSLREIPVEFRFLLLDVLQKSKDIISSFFASKQFTSENRPGK